MVNVVRHDPGMTAERSRFNLLKAEIVSFLERYEYCEKEVPPMEMLRYASLTNQYYEMKKEYGW